MVVVAGLITGNVQPTPTYIMVKYTHITTKASAMFCCLTQTEMFQDSDLCLHSSCNIPLFCFIVSKVLTPQTICTVPTNVKEKEG